MAIQRRPSVSNIVSKKYSAYNPATFDMHKYDNFIECDADFVLANIRPAEFTFLPGKKFIAYDTETFYTGVRSNRMPSNVVRRFLQRKSKTIPQDFPFCMSFCDGINSFAVYDTLENKFAEFKKLAPLLADHTVGKIGQNVDFDLHMTANVGVDILGELHDTMFMSKLLRGQAHTHNLADISDEIRCEEFPTVTIFEGMVDAYKDSHRITDYRDIPRELMTQYTCGDTWNAFYAFKSFFPDLALANVAGVYETERQILKVAYKLERRGIPIDPAYEAVLIPELEQEAAEAEQAIYDEVGHAFNINSSQQLYKVLADLGHGSKVKRKKPTEKMLEKGIVIGNPKLDSEAMEALENEGVEIVTKIQTYKKAEKLLNTFARKLYVMCDAANRVHCTVNTIEAKTGRFSISSPSMQNMPRRKDSRVRSAFVPPEDYVLYDFDFRAQESFILIHYARPAELMQALADGLEIHRLFATRIFSVPYDAVDKELRNISKSVEFAIVYGAGPPKVAAMTKLPIEKAKEAMVSVLRNIPEIDMFIRTANNVAKERGYVNTIDKRKVYVQRGREYACVNYIIQGSAASSTKRRMIDIHKFLMANNFKTHMLLQVHDSLLEAVHKDEEDFMLGYLKWLQTDRELFRVTIEVDVTKCHPTWRDKDELNIEAVEPPAEMLEKMKNYDIWKESILV